MAPPIPPRPTEKKQPQNQQDGSARAAFDHDATSKKKTHVRLDSVGSTRGAFYKHQDDHAKHRDVRGHRKKKSPKKTAPKSEFSSNAEAMGNMASLAMAGLGNEDFGGLLEGASPLRETRSKPHPFSRTGDTPMASDTEAPKGFQTILDNSGNKLSYHSNKPAPSHGTPPPSRSAYASSRNTQSSDRSLDFNTAMGFGPPSRGVPRRESLTLPVNSLDNSASNNNFLANLRGDTIRSVGSGLVGTDIPLNTQHHFNHILMNDDTVEVTMPPGHAMSPYQPYYQQGPVSTGPPQPHVAKTSRPKATSRQQQDIANFASMAQQQEDIANFASMVQADYGTNHPPPPFTPPERQPSQFSQLSRTLRSELDEDNDDVEDDDDDDEPFSYVEEDHMTCSERVKHFLDPTDFLLSDVKEYDEDGNPIFDNENGGRWTIPGLLRHFLYNPEYPEFTSLQQFNWAVILGVIMGIYTAVWKNIIEQCVDFVWQTVPEKLLKWGIFTDLDGKFPLPYYMCICPAVFGGVSAYIEVLTYERNVVSHSTLHCRYCPISL